MNAAQRRRKRRAPKRAEWKAKAAERDTMRPDKAPSEITGGRRRPVSLSLRTGRHSAQHVDRPRVAEARKAKSKRRNQIALASRRRNRR